MAEGVLEDGVVDAEVTEDDAGELGEEEDGPSVGHIVEDIIMPMGEWNQQPNK